MRPDPDYIKSILAAFQDFDEPSMTIEDLEEFGFSYQDKVFYFHMRLLEDQGFIESEDGDSGLGVSISVDGRTSWGAVPLRLTASGHAFAEALNSHPGWEAVKKSGISTSIGIMKEIAVAALKAELVKHSLLPH